MSTKPLSFGSLFTGIGGFDLGLERAGMICKWQVEIDDYCRRVLAKHWPDILRYRDIREVNFDEIEKVDVLCGGFPCQPVSLAGKGLAQDDPRWLWPEFAGAIRALRPRYVAMENVPGLLVRGMGDVLGDLAALGYAAEWQVLSAAAFGAPHLRERVFVIAHADSGGMGEQHLQPQVLDDEAGQDCVLAYTQSTRIGQVSTEQVGENSADTDGLCSSMAHPAGQRGKRRPTRPAETEVGRAHSPTQRRGQVPSDPNGGRWSGADHQPEGEDSLFVWADLAGSRAKGVTWWSTEPAVGRMAYGIPRRVDRLKGLGNAVVPQAIELIGTCIIKHYHASQAR